MLHVNQKKRKRCLGSRLSSWERKIVIIVMVMSVSYIKGLKEDAEDEEKKKKMYAWSIY